MSAPLLSRRSVFLGLAAPAALPLAACGGPDETTARRAFIAFLETRVLAPRGLRVPRLSDDELTAFGPYGKHWEPLQAYHATLDRDLAPLLSNAARILPALRSPSDWAGQAGGIAESRKLLHFAREGLLGLEHKTAGAVTWLRQPNDLRAVYGRAHARLVVEVTPVFRGGIEGLDGLLAAIADAGAFLGENRGQFRVSGVTYVTSDATLRARLDAHSAAVAAAQERMMALRTPLSALLGRG